ncbi:MAG: RimK family alpha-L-glutamate ligase [Deltaproteobacteria bacterium]|nr:RimK family alpha-L-glutamate ligase [Deltaproteobacteria bacterium]
MRQPFIALGSRLRGVPEVLTLGVKPNFMDYSPDERDLILGTSVVLYPTRNYAQFLTTLGRPIFPSLETHLYADEKIKQTTLFTMLGIPHPRTRFYYALHHKDIVNDFQFPFIAKLPRCSAQGRGVFKIENAADLDAYLARTKVAYIQAYLPHVRDLRVVAINYRPVLAYWRVVSRDNFRANVAQGAELRFGHIPDRAIALAMDTARKCRFDDVGLDLIESRGKWHVIEANMKYGRKGLKLKGMDLKQIIREKLLSGEIGSRTVDTEIPSV